MGGGAAGSWAPRRTLFHPTDAPASGYPPPAGEAPGKRGANEFAAANTYGAGMPAATAMENNL